MANQLSTYTHKQFFNAPTVQKAFDDVWKGAGTQFAVSILSVLQGSQSLKSASNKSMSIRGINGVVVHGDSLTRQVKNIYFLQNTKDDMLSFSDINVMPRTQDIEREFNVKEWIGDAIVHVESKLNAR